MFVFSDQAIAVEYSIATTGAAIKWLSSIIGENYAAMNVLAEHSPPGANGVTFDLSLDSAGCISGLTLASKKGDVVRALYESICHEIKNGIDKLGGAKEIHVFGGGSKSRILRDILTEVTGIKVSTSDTAETASLGAAMLAKEGVVKC
jgi:sugar (pentulose or hexulose) kinase